MILVGRSRTLNSVFDRAARSGPGRLIGSTVGRLMATAFVLFFVVAGIAAVADLFLGNRTLSGCGVYRQVGAECSSDD